MELICIKHPFYNGENQPELTCKTCCTIFICKVKKRYNEGEKGPFNNQGKKTCRSSKLRLKQKNLKLLS